MFHHKSLVQLRGKGVHIYFLNNFTYFCYAFSFYFKNNKINTPMAALAYLLLALTCLLLHAFLIDKSFINNMYMLFFRHFPIKFRDYLRSAFLVNMWGTAPHFLELQVAGFLYLNFSHVSLHFKWCFFRVLLALLLPPPALLYVCFPAHMRQNFRAAVDFPAAQTII